MIDIITQNLWTFGFSSQEGINVPVWPIVGFQQRDRQNSARRKLINFEQLL